MAAVVDVSILGDVELERKLRRIPLALQKNAITKAFRRSAKIIKQAASAKIPTSIKRTRPGAHLKNSLMVRALTKKQKKKGVIGIRIVTPNRDRIGVESNEKYYYPAVIELGSKKRGIRGTQFMRRALAENRHRIKRILINDIRAELKKFEGRLMPLGGIA